MRTWLTPGHEYNICFSPESLVTKKNILSCQKVIKRLELHAYFKKKKVHGFYHELYSDLDIVATV